MQVVLIKYIFERHKTPELALYPIYLQMATNSDFSFRLVTSSKGKNKLSHDGYAYIFHRGIVKKEWRCDIRGCKARVNSIANLIVKRSGEHSHPKEIGKKEV